MKIISFVIPCYCSELTVEKVVQQIKDTMKNIKEYDYEIILVNDGSKDNTCKVLKSLATSASKVKAIDLAKNSGQHAALLAGFNQVSGELVVTVDDDGQTPVENLPLMMEKLEEGYDIVSAKYVKRNQPSKFRRMGTWMNKKMVKYLLECPDDVTFSVFSLYRRFVIDEVIKYDQPYPYLKGLVLRITHNIGNVEMEQRAREVGQSGYSFGKLISLWLNGFTAFSIKPLRLATMCGTISAGCGFLFAIITLIRKLVVVHIQVGWSSLISIMLFLGGIVLIMLGVMGEYLGRAYMCINRTPQFVVRGKYGFEDEEEEKE